jgi:hypothetical protein
MGVMSSRGFVSCCAGVLVVAVASMLVCSATVLAAGPPVIDGESVSHVGTASATLSAQINPEESASTYRFEYGPTEAYGSRVPLSDATVGSGGEDVTVSQPLSGLQAGSVYHYRVIATSSEGTTEGSDKTLKTYALESAGGESCPNAGIRQTQFSTYLPDCRAYELVSPVDKEGASIGAAASGGTVSSGDGSAVKYDSSVGFGDVQGFEGHGAEYVSSRGPGGWTTHAISPKQASVALGVYTSSQYEAFSEDLSKGVFFGYTPVVPGHPNVEHATNLYLRSDVLAGPLGNYELLTDSVVPVPAESDVPQPYQANVAYVGASADFSHVVFQSDNDMTVEAAGLSPALPKVYEWFDGTVRLVGILPDGKPAEGSVGGRGAGGGESSLYYQHNWTLNSVSADGSRVVFEATPFRKRAAEGYAEVEGDLYMRVDGRETVRLNASERSSSKPDPSGPQPAQFFGATPDDSKVFFITEGLLTDDASGRRNLYMYDINAPAGKHLTLLSVDEQPCGGCSGSPVMEGDFLYGSSEDRATHVLPDGISRDGSYVYFIGRSPLVAGQLPLKYEEEELYVWHNGVVRAITKHFEKYAGGTGWGERKPETQNEFRITPDGRYAVFTAGGRSQVELEAAFRAAGLGVPPPPFHSEVFLYSYETERLRCVSCNPSGADSEGNSHLNNEQADLSAAGGTIITQYLSRPLSDDGSYVFFETDSALLPQDTNGERDVYEYDSRSGELRLVSSGACGCVSTFVDASRDGSSVFFTTHQKLVVSDVDDSADMYVARIDGGIQSQNGLLVAPCEGDDCQGPAKLSPVFSLPSSSTFAGVGNAVQPVSVSVKHRSKGLTDAQKLRRALAVCRRKPKRGRRVCEARAKHRYGAGHVSRSRTHKSRRVGA